VKTAAYDLQDSETDQQHPGGRGQRGLVAVDQGAGRRRAHAQRDQHPGQVGIEHRGAAQQPGPAGEGVGEERRQQQREAPGDQAAVLVAGLVGEQVVVVGPELPLHPGRPGGDGGRHRLGVHPREVPPHRAHHTGIHILVDNRRLGVAGERAAVGALVVAELHDRHRRTQPS
jgi:hypothetical protein